MILFSMRSQIIAVANDLLSSQLHFGAKLVTAGAANSLSPAVQAARWGHHLLLETSLSGSQCRWMLTRHWDGVCHPWLGSSYTSSRPPAAVVASYSPKEMKFHLNEIRGLDGDQALQMCSEDITICTQKPQCHLIAHPLPQKPVPKF